MIYLKNFSKIKNNSKDKKMGFSSEGAQGAFKLKCL